MPTLQFLFCQCKKLNSRYHSCSWLDGGNVNLHELLLKNEALFSDTKIVTSVYSQSFEGTLDAEMINKCLTL
jgi:hypothetical protein